MIIFIHYEEEEDKQLHNVSKITLTPKWIEGKLGDLLSLYLKKYNLKNPLNQLIDVHIQTDKDEPLSNDCIVSDYLYDGCDVYVKHGDAPKLEEVKAPKANNRSFMDRYFKVNKMIKTMNKLSEEYSVKLDFTSRLLFFFTDKILFIYVLVSHVYNLFKS
jgi:hypothetical protein